MLHLIVLLLLSVSTLCSLCLNVSSVESKRSVFTEVLSSDSEEVRRLPSASQLGRRFKPAWGAVVRASGSGVSPWSCQGSPSPQTGFATSAGMLARPALQSPLKCEPTLLSPLGIESLGSHFPKHTHFYIHAFTHPPPPPPPPQKNAHKHLCSRC